MILEKTNRFLFIAPRYHTNQIHVVKALINDGHMVNFLAIEKEHIEDYTSIEPLIIKPSILYKIIKRILRLNISQDRKYTIPSLRYVIESFKAFKPDVIIIRNPYYIYSIFFLIVSKFVGAKPLLYTQDPYYTKKITNKHKMINLLCKLFKAKWITPVRGYESDKKISKHIHFLPLVHPVFRIDKPLIRKEVNILMVGKFVQIKRHLLLIESFNELAQKYKNIRLILVGEKTKSEHFEVYKEVDELISKYNLKNIIKVHFNIPNNEMSKFYIESDVFVLPSNGETYGYSSLEAISYGCPIVVSNNNGFQYNIINGFNGFVFNADDKADLINKIELLITDKKYKTLFSNCLEYVEVNHSELAYLKKLQLILAIK